MSACACYLRTRRRRLLVIGMPQRERQLSEKRQLEADLTSSAGFLPPFIAVPPRNIHSETPALQAYQSKATANNLESGLQVQLIIRCPVEEFVLPFTILCYVTKAAVGHQALPLPLCPNLLLRHGPIKVPSLLRYVIGFTRGTWKNTAASDRSCSNTATLYSTRGSFFMKRYIGMHITDLRTLLYQCFHFASVYDQRDSAKPGAFRFHATDLNSLLSTVNVQSQPSHVNKRFTNKGFFSPEIRAPFAHMSIQLTRATITLQINRAAQDLHLIATHCQRATVFQ